MKTSKAQTFYTFFVIRYSANATFNKFNVDCGIAHDMSAVFLPLRVATCSGDSMERKALIVALTTLTGFVEP